MASMPWPGGATRRGGLESPQRERSSVGRALASQAKGRGFEARRSLLGRLPSGHNRAVAEQIPLPLNYAPDFDPVARKQVLPFKPTLEVIPLGRCFVEHQ